ncbi:MAG: type II toxin-antitoxin system PemK/MazF family toxin [Candidatus Woesearchaeota archaeon]|nr:type II toxin-antitoxin system PemK/MazF family toxin [Candidatus Woesearchaeota archaeon]
MKGDIVLVTFPFSDLSETKLRPAVVVATPGGSNTILCQITTKKRKNTAYEVSLPRSDCNGDIRFDSNIYVDMLFTLHQDLVQRKLGTIRKATKEKIAKKIRKLFATS